MTFQSNSLRKYGLSFALLLLIVLAAVLSLFVLSTHNTPAHADGLFVLKVDKSQSGNGKVFLISSANPAANIQISVDDYVAATFLSGTTSGSITVKAGTHTIIGRYVASDGTVIESEPTSIEVNSAGKITYTNHSYQSSVSQPDSSAMSPSDIDSQPTVPTIDQQPDNSVSSSSTQQDNPEENS